ncbi:parallel beta-helix repeat-containing transcriptional regulator AraC [Nitratireductor indicus C115]|uniref:Parallel beta-helix repeat-containing transcriptional regulator AraC n=1 Tax=Nitratireductor indicus C115 TaxID=1231190 RepID=K2PRZ1_9HYPH|nr:DUF11 domain-containing protein [Nitratireductor indicus]EKF43847.1 parallel beta-helix repeat-containing transcriptional regulator AraC [Nitratireductor indicus C115]
MLVLMVCGIAAAMIETGPAFAQQGIGIQGEAISGLIGIDKNGTGSTACPAGQFLVGVTHSDIVSGTTTAIGMTGRVDLSCASITTDGTAVTLGVPSAVSGRAYANSGTPQTATCPAGEIAFYFYGRDRISNAGGDRWASQVGIACRPVMLAAGDWIQLDSSVPVVRRDAGNVENNGTHTSRGPFCGSQDVTYGYAIQLGGVGYDGIKARCANFSQARHSAHLTFDNFAWDQSIGGTGWLVDLTRNSTAMTEGVGKLPYASVSANDAAEFQEMYELYVHNGADYGATAGQRPSGIDTNTYVELGSCAQGQTLALRQDNTCTLTVAGRPDIAVTMTPPATFTGYAEPQTLTMTATNYGPGATGSDGYTLVATLPAGWSVDGTLPADCAVSGQLVTCALDPSPLAAAASPGASGGTKSFDIPVAVDYPTAGGTHDFSVALGRSVPDGDGNPANVDYDTSNDSVTSSFDFQPTPAAVAEPNKTVTDANGNGIAEPGEQLTYTITLTNNGSTDATNYGVTDNLDPNTTHQSSDNGGSHAGGSPGGTVTWSNLTVPAQVGSTPGTLVLTTIVTVVDPLPPGARISNGAYQTGTTPPDCSANPPPSSCAVLAIAASLQLQKTATLNDANGNGQPDVGESIDYAFTVANTGGLNIDNITLTDPNVPISGGAISLAPGDSNSSAFSAVHVLAAEDIDAGRFENQASAQGTASDGTAVTDLSDDPSDSTDVDANGDGEPDDVTVVTLVRNPSYDFIKEGVLDDANGNGQADAGEVINYTFTVENTGNVTLTDVTVTDSKATVSGSPIPTLAAGAVDDTSVTGTYVVTEADLASGSVDNVASATAKDPQGNDISKQSRPRDGAEGDSTSLETPMDASYDFVKEAAHDDANGNGLIDAGEVMNYTFTVTNTGNVSLTDVVVTDSRATVSGSPLAGPLAPGAVDTTSVTGTYTVTQADIDAGDLDNVASATAKDPNGDDVSRQSRPPDGTEGDPTRPPGGVQKVSDYDFVKDAAHDDANGNGLMDAGEIINYTFTVTNTGNTTLTDVTVTDDRATVSGSPIPTLAPGTVDNTSVTGVYTITQADIDAGKIENVASATAKDPDGNDVSKQSAPPGGNPGDPSGFPEVETVSDYDFVKEATHDDANGNGRVDVNETINYVFTVENTGNTTLTDVVVTDSKATVSGSPIPTLAPGAVDATSVTGVYTVTQADIDSGNVENTATATAKDPKGNDITQTSRPPGGNPGESTDFPVEGKGEFDLVKDVTLNDANGNGFADAGETLSYAFTVTNTGNVSLTDIVVTDSKATVSGSPIAGPLAPGDSDTSATGSYTIQQADVDSGSFENTASAVAKDPKGEDVTAVSRPPDGAPGDTTVITFEANPSVKLELVDTLVDLDGDGFPEPGETVTYAFRIINTGNVTLSGLSIASLDVSSVDIVVPADITPLAAVPVSGGPISSLLPGAEDTGTFTASHPLTAADIEDGRIDATALVTGSAPNGDPVSDISNDPDSSGTVGGEGQSDNPTVTLLPQKLSLALEKSGAYQGAPGRFAEAGDTILYTFTVTNDGNVPASDVKPADPGPTFNGKPATGALSAFSPASANLDPGQSQDFTASYTLSDADVANAQNVEDGIVNKATAEGTGLKGRKAQAPEAMAIVNLPGFAITKMTPLSEVRRGGRVPYTIRVKPLGLSGSMVTNIVDQTPVGFAYVSGTATLDGNPATPKVEGRRLVFENVTLQNEQAVEIGLTLAVTAAAKPDEYVNRAWVEDLTGNVISFIARAVVEVVVEAVFDCGDILGKVFDDKNRNGYQDAGEPGLPGVRVATVKGLLVTSDQHGRFHVACAELPDQRIGTNYILKLDPRSLPSGYRITTENPRVVRLTAGKASEFSFGASIGRVVRLDLTDEAFDRGMIELRPEWRERVSRLITVLDQEPSVLRLSYYGADSRSKLVARRLKAVRKLIADEWRNVGGRYRLEIETRAETGAPASTLSGPVYK